MGMLGTGNKKNLDLPLLFAKRKLSHYFHYSLTSSPPNLP